MNINLINVLDYANSIYDFTRKINAIERKNKNADTKVSTTLKMLSCGVLTGTKSINLLQKAIFDSNNNRFKNIFSPKEKIPKTHALRDCVNDIDYLDVRNVHFDMIKKMKDNKFFDNHNYRNKNVMIVDGIETFETHKNIEGLHLRNHKDGTTGYYYKALGEMYLTEDVNVMIDLVPFEKCEVEDDKEHNNKVKSEGEITVFKRILPSFKEYKIEIAVLDCMFLNAPCFNTAKENGIDCITKLTDTRRLLYKDASKLFEQEDYKAQYEIVEIIETKNIKYSKKSKKKDKYDSKKYITTRPISDKKLNEKTIVEKKTVVHPKKQVTTKITEKVIKRVRVKADNFEMEEYEYGLVKVIKVEEETKKETNEMYIVTTILDDDLEFIVDLMHRRWDIELCGFRKFKSRYNLKHLYIGTNNAIRLIMYLILIIYNLIEMYFNIHTRKYKHSINFDNLFEDYKIEIYANKEYTSISK